MYRAHMTACALSVYIVRPSRVDSVHSLSVLSHAMRLSARSAIAYLMGISFRWGVGSSLSRGGSSPLSVSHQTRGQRVKDGLPLVLSLTRWHPSGSPPAGGVSPLAPRRGWPAQWPASGAALSLSVGGAGCWEAGPDKRPGDWPAIGAPGASRVVEPGTACAVAGRGGTAADCTAGRTGSAGRRRPDSRQPAHPLTLSAGAPRPARRRRLSLPCAPPAPWGAYCV